MENIQKAPMDLMTSHGRLVLPESVSVSIEARKQGLAGEFPNNMMETVEVPKDEKKSLVGARKRKAQKVLKHKVLSSEVQERPSPEPERIPILPPMPNLLDMHLTLCHYGDRQVNRTPEKTSDGSRASDSDLSSYEGDEFRRRSECDDRYINQPRSMGFPGTDQLSMHQYLYHHYENMEPGFESSGAFRTLQRMQEYSRLVKSSVARVKEEPKDLADIPSILSVTSAVTKQNNSPQSFDSAIASPESFADDSQAMTKAGDADGDNKEEEGDCDPYASLLRDMKLRGEFPCRLCDMVFPNLRALKGHNRVHLHAAPYQCNMCPTSSNDKSALIRHMRTHNGDRPFECRICQFAFTTKANCERHLRNLHGKKNREELRAAIIFHTNEEAPPQAPPPPPAAEKKDEKKEFKIMERYNYRCNACNSVISDAKLREHLLLYHFNSSQDVYSHYQKIRPDVEISLVKNVPENVEYLGKMPRLEPAETAAVNALVDFAKEMPKPALAPMPPKRQTFSVYEDHQMAPLDLSVKATPRSAPVEASAPPTPLFPFPFFVNPYAKNWDHLSHAQWSTPLDMSSFVRAPIAPPPPPPPARIPSPPKSPETTDDGQDVRLVMKNGILVKKQKQRRYRTERPFECEFCNGRFTLRSNMERHAKQQHPEAWNARMKGKIYESFKSPSADGEEPESSGEESDDQLVVDEEFRRLDPRTKYESELPSLEKLMELTKNRVCMQEKEQPEAKSPTDKKKSAYSNAPHRVTCPYCPRRFPWTSSLRRHILTHTGQKPFKCTYCPLWFTTKSNCDRHLARKHGANNEKKAEHRLSSDEAESHCSSPSSGEIGAIESIFACHVCGDLFHEQHPVIEHVRAMHAHEFEAILARQETLGGGRTSDSESRCGSYDDDSESSHEEEPLRRVSCAFCPQSYWSTSELRRHMLHHNGAQPHECGACGKRFVLRRSLLAHMEKHHEEAMDLSP